MVQAEAKHLITSVNKGKSKNYLRLEFDSKTYEIELLEKFLEEFNATKTEEKNKIKLGEFVEITYLGDIKSPRVIKVVKPRLFKIVTNFSNTLISSQHLIQFNTLVPYTIYSSKEGLTVYKNSIYSIDANMIISSPFEEKSIIMHFENVEQLNSLPKNEEDWINSKDFLTYSWKGIRLFRKYFVAMVVVYLANQGKTFGEIQRLYDWKLNKVPSENTI